MHTQIKQVLNFSFSKFLFRYECTLMMSPFKRVFITFLKFSNLTYGPHFSKKKITTNTELHNIAKN